MEEVFYYIGDKRILSKENISTDQAFKKLDYMMRSYFDMIEKTDILLELKFFQAIKINNLFLLNIF